MPAVLLFIVARSELEKERNIGGPVCSTAKEDVRHRFILANLAANGMPGRIQ